MFDLEQAIGEWRRRLAATGLTNPKVLDELESHLRDDIAERMRSGTEVQEAFEAAAKQMGHGQAIRGEFGKLEAKPRAVWQNVSVKFLAAVSIVLLSGALAAILTNAFSLPMTTGERVQGTLLLALLFLTVWVFLDQMSRQQSGELGTFTTAAVQSLGGAREEARDFCHDFIGTEHVLLGLMKDEDGMARKILGRAGVHPQALRDEIENLIGSQPPHPCADNIPYTPRVKASLMRASATAKRLRHSSVNPGHILLGLLQDGNGAAVQALRNLGVDLRQMHQAVLAELAGEQRG